MPMRTARVFDPKHVALPPRFFTPVHLSAILARTIKSACVGGLFVLVCSVSLADGDFDTWVKTGPLGGRVFCVAVHPDSVDTIYAALEEGLYRSTDGGESWERLPTSWYALEVILDPLYPNVVYARTSTRLYRSTDTGETWEEVATFRILSFAMDPNYPQRLFVGTDNGFGTGNGFVYKSTDRGDSWVKRDTGSWCSISALAVSPGDSNTVYAGTSPYEPEMGGDGVYRSTDGGLTWQSAGLPYCIIGCLAVDPSDPLVVYAASGCGDGGDMVFKSTDGGDTWEPAGAGLSSGGFVTTLTVDPARPGVLYAGTFNGLFKTTTGGSIWSPVDTGIDEGDINSVSIFPLDTDVVFLGGTGVFRSASGGEDLLLLGVIPVGISSAVVDREDSQTIFAIGKWAYKTTDFGAHWQPINNGMGGGLVIVQDPVDAQVLYGGSYHYYWGGVYKTTNAGATWQRTSLRDVAINDIAIAPTNPNIVFAVGSGVYKTENAGDTWATVDQGRAECIAVEPTNAEIVYAGSLTGLRKSTDGGDTWFPIEDGLNLPASGYVLAIAIDPLQPQVLYCGTTYAGVFKSVNGGMSWMNASTGMTCLDTRAIAIDPSKTDIVYAATWWGGGVFASRNGALVWSEMDADSGLPGIVDLALDPNQPNVIYAAGGGLWRYTATPLAPMVSCPVDTTILPFSTLPSLVLRGFAITNSSEEDSSSFYYHVTAEGPCTLADNGNPSSLSGTTPLLGPGDSYAPPNVLLLVPPIRVLVTEYVRYDVSANRPGGGTDTCVSAIEFQPPVPVFISSFTALPTNAGVELTWAVLADEEVRGFRVYRRLLEKDIGPGLITPELIPRDVTSFTDTDAHGGNSYEYQLGVVLADQSEVMSPPSQVTVPALSLELYQNVPNPFDVATTIGFTLPARSEVELAIYDVRGQLVRTIVDDVLDEGYKEIAWDGTDRHGHRVSSGLFFCRLASGSRTLTKKVLLLR